MLATVLLAAGCGAYQGVRVEGPAPTGAAETRTVYVLDEMGNPLQRPRDLALTEFSSLNRLRWTSWGGATATATGEVSGTWSEHAYPAKVTLTGLELRERSAYYGRAEVEAPGLPADQAAELRDLKLLLPPD